MPQCTIMPHDVMMERKRRARQEAFPSGEIIKDWKVPPSSMPSCMETLHSKLQEIWPSSEGDCLVELSECRLMHQYYQHYLQSTATTNTVPNKHSETDKGASPDSEVTVESRCEEDDGASTPTLTEKDSDQISLLVVLPPPERTDPTLLGRKLHGDFAALQDLPPHWGHVNAILCPTYDEEWLLLSADGNDASQSLSTKEGPRFSQFIWKILSCLAGEQDDESIRLVLDPLLWEHHDFLHLSGFVSRAERLDAKVRILQKLRLRKIAFLPISPAPLPQKTTLFECVWTEYCSLHIEKIRPKAIVVLGNDGDVQDQEWHNLANRTGSKFLGRFTFGENVIHQNGQAAFLSVLRQIRDITKSVFGTRKFALASVTTNEISLLGRRKGRPDQKNSSNGPEGADPQQDCIDALLQFQKSPGTADESHLANAVVPAMALTEPVYPTLKNGALQHHQHHNLSHFSENINNSSCPRAVVVSREATPSTSVQAESNHQMLHAVRHVSSETTRQLHLQQEACHNEDDDGSPRSVLSVRSAPANQRPSYDWLNSGITDNALPHNTRTVLHHLLHQQGTLVNPTANSVHSSELSEGAEQPPESNSNLPDQVAETMAFQLPMISNHSHATSVTSEGNESDQEKLLFQATVELESPIRHNPQPPLLSRPMNTRNQYFNTSSTSSIRMVKTPLSQFITEVRSHERGLKIQPCSPMKGKGNKDFDRIKMLIRSQMEKEQAEEDERLGLRPKRKRRKASIYDPDAHNNSDRRRRNVPSPYPSDDDVQQQKEQRRKKVFSSPPVAEENTPRSTKRRRTPKADETREESRKSQTRQSKDGATQPGNRTRRKGREKKKTVSDVEEDDNISAPADKIEDLPTTDACTESVPKNGKSLRRISTSSQRSSNSETTTENSLDDHKKDVKEGTRPEKLDEKEEVKSDKTGESEHDADKEETDNEANDTDGDENDNMDNDETGPTSGRRKYQKRTEMVREEICAVNIVRSKRKRVKIVTYDPEVQRALDNAAYKKAAGVEKRGANKPKRSRTRVDKYDPHVQRELDDAAYKAAREVVSVDENKTTKDFDSSDEELELIKKKRKEMERLKAEAEAEAEASLKTKKITSTNSKKEHGKRDQSASPGENERKKADTGRVAKEVKPRNSAGKTGKRGPGRPPRGRKKKKPTEEKEEMSSEPKSPDVSKAPDEALPVKPKAKRGRPRKQDSAKAKNKPPTPPLPSPPKEGDDDDGEKVGMYREEICEVNIVRSKRKRVKIVAYDPEMQRALDKAAYKKAALERS